MTALVIGVDEAGRGCLAGPVFAAAVVWSDVQLAHANKDFPLIRDSKKLSSKQRQEAHDYIIEHAAAYAVAYADANAVDDMGVMGATMSAMHEAINEGVTHECIVKGDDKELSIAAASILAKVTRDDYMASQAECDKYRWKENKGYGTAAHMEALRVHGPCSEHRMTFRPVHAAIK